MGLASIRKLRATIRRLTSGLTAVKLKAVGDTHTLGNRTLPARSISLVTLRYDPEALRRSDIRFQAVTDTGEVVLDRKLYPPRDKPIRIYADEPTKVRLQTKALVLKKNKPLKFEIAASVEKVQDFPAPAPSIFAPRSRTVSMATYPAREGTIIETLESLSGQCDQLMLYMNGYREAPSFVRAWAASGWLNFVLDPRGDLRATAKFHWTHQPGYHFLCDDDIIYPPDYIERHEAAIERYERQAVVGVLGVEYEPVVIDAYHSRRANHRFHEAMADDAPVHLLGTGTAAFHSDTVADFDWTRIRRYPASNDEAFAVEARRHGVPLVAIARPHEWLKGHPDMHYGLFEEKLRDPAIRSRANAIISGLNPWPLPTLPAIDPPSIAASA